MKNIQSKTQNTFFLLIYSLFLFNLLTINTQANSTNTTTIVKTWYLLPVKPGSIPDHRIKADEKIKLIFQENNSFIYLNEHKNIKIKGSWKVIDSVKKLLLYDENEQIIRDFVITRCSEKELVLNTSNSGFVYRSELSPKFVFSSLRAISGILILIFIVFLFSKNRKKINWYIPAIGLVLQLVIAILILKVGFIRTGFGFVSSFFVHLLEFTDEGARFVFGSLVDKTDQFGIIFAFKILPTVILYILQRGIITR